MQRFADRLTEYLSDRAGSSLRAVVRFDDEAYHVDHVRDDLDETAVSERAAEIFGNLHTTAVKQADHLTGDLGAVRSTLEVREQAVILRFPFPDGEDVLVSLEPEAARQLNMFIEECLRNM